MEEELIQLDLVGEEVKEKDPIQETLEKLVQEGDEEIVVDWKLFHDLEGFRTMTLKEQMYSAAVEKLQELNILSYEENGNYELSSDGPIILNPRYWT